MQANQTSVVWTVVIAAVVLLVVSLFAFSGFNSNLKLLGEKVDDVSVNETAIANVILEGIEVPDYPEFPDYMNTEKEYEKGLMGDEAERLALAELDSKDFKELLQSSLQDKINALTIGKQNEQKGYVIESYKDIEDAYSIDVENVIAYHDNETAIVEIEFKIKYVLDEDEDLVGKARVTITYSVSELVVDDDFEDAEVDEDFTDNPVEIYLYKNLV